MDGRSGGGMRLLHYRAWRGQSHGALFSIWPIARVSLSMILRRKIFWGLYGMGLLFFFMFFFGQYLLAWAKTQVGEETVRVGIVRGIEPGKLIDILRVQMRLNGSGYTYRNFFWYQGYMVVIVLALAGSIIVGNDFQFGSLPFYLSKPLNRWHYLIGKCLAVGLVVNLMTTLPALVLYVQYGLLESWSYFVDNFNLLLGILGYGMVLTVSLSLLLVATATWLQRMVPMIMTWATLFFFFPLLARALVHDYNPRWRLIDLWNNAYLIGSAFLGVGTESISAMEAALVLGALALVCLIYLNLRIRAVEIVR
jgi:ABC-type transport system involved in multi-copper enzyme maturation permease subunit